MEKHDQHVAVRLDDDIVARIDALLPKLARPWGEPTRSEVIRLMLTTALDRAEKDPTFLRDDAAEPEGSKT
jgi:hypothetical protein